MLCNPKCSAFCPHSWAARSNKFSLLASPFIRTSVVARRHLSRQALSLAVYFYACDSFFRKRHFCGFLIRFLQSVVFYFKGLEVALQPKMLCILPPLVGCTLEQVLAVSESLRRRKPTSFIARRCLAPLSVAFSSFVKTKFCRIFPIQTTAPFLMLPFIARQVLSLAPPLSPKQISASLPRFVCFILTKKIPAIIGGNFYRFCKFIQSYVKLLPLHF